MHRRQKGAKFIEMESSGLKSPDPNAEMMQLLGFPTPCEEYLSVELEFRRPSRGGGLPFDDDELVCRQLPNDSEPLFQFIACLFHGLLLQRQPRCFARSAFIATLFCGHLLRRSSGDSPLCAKTSKDACWCSTHQCRRVSRIGWVTCSTNSAVRVFYPTLMCDTVTLSTFLTFSARLVHPCLRLHTSASSLCILSSVI